MIEVRPMARGAADPLTLTETPELDVGKGALNVAEVPANAVPFSELQWNPEPKAQPTRQLH